MLLLNPAYLAPLLFELRISALFNVLFKVCSYCLNIGQDQLNVALAM